MRLAGEAKAGFYPTPELVARRIRSCLQSTGPMSLIDPCCGRGEALELVGQGFRGVVHGVELESERAEAARERLDLVLQGDSLSTRVHGKYGLLYLNPPYHQAEGKRLELRFLWYWLRYLTPGGVLIYVVPEGYLPEYSKTLGANFENISIYRFPGETYEAFGQVVVFGTKRQHAGHAGTLPEVAGELEVRSATFPVPRQDELPAPYLANQDPEQLVAEAHASRLWERVWDAITPQTLDSGCVKLF